MPCGVFLVLAALAGYACCCAMAFCMHIPPLYFAVVSVTVVCAFIGGVLLPKVALL